MEPPRGSSGPLPLRRHRQKRLKIDVACETCRAKKVKCDGVRPACSYCSRKPALKETCRYSNDDATVKQKHRPNHTLNHDKPGPSPPSLSNLEKDVSRQPGMQQTGLSPATSSGRGPPQPPNRYPMRSPNGSALDIRQTRDYQGSDPSVAGNMATPSIVDSMTAVVDEGTSTREYFGSSSAGSFTAQIKRAIDSRVGKSHNGSSGHCSTATARQHGSISGFSSGFDLATDVPYVLPSRRQADYLVDMYWFYVDPLYPFLDKKLWYHDYNAIFAGTAIDIDERIFVATLNVILALASQLVESLSVEQREESSNRYFERAQELLPMNTWGSGSLDLVQYLLLTSQYLQSTNQPHQTWMVVGSAIRTAQGLGLHLPETSAELSELSERELLRRIWYGCVLMDRMVSVTHGRPAMISEHVVNDVPLPISSQKGVDLAEILGNNAEHASFLVNSVQLYEIIHKTTAAIYTGKTARTKCKNYESLLSYHDDEGEDLGMVVRLDRLLNKWEMGLPDNFKWSRLSQSTDEIARRQTVILRMRFLHARVLLLRPVLSRFCLSYSPNDEASSIDTLQARVTEQAAQLCVSTAQSIVSILVEHQAVDGTVGLLPAWWYRVYYVYSAATILIATRLRPEAFAAADPAPSWAQAMSVLKSHEKFGNSARRCVAALHILSAKMLEAVPSSSGTSSRCTRERKDVSEAVEEPGTDDVRDYEAMHMPTDAGHASDRDIQHHMFIDEFAPPTADLGGLDLAEFDFDVNDLSWLNDMHATWGFLNE